MGAGSTIQQNSRISQEIDDQKGKPCDGSDIVDLNQARGEIVRIRGIIHSLPTGSPRNRPSDPQEAAQSEYNSTIQINSDGNSINAKALPIMSAIKTKIGERYNTLFDAFLAVDTDRSGFISKDEFVKVYACLHES
jgi:hypothetical protein